MSDLDYIKKFNSIQITKVCKKLGIDYANLISGRSSSENEEKVRKELEYEFAKLYIDKIIKEVEKKEGNSNEENTTLKEMG